MMNSEGRTERIVAGLEKYFDDCNGLVNDHIEDAHRNGDHLRAVLNVLKTGTQIAGVIARLEAQASRNSEKRGSIPQ
jgi:hypothetical protein